MSEDQAPRPDQSPDGATSGHVRDVAASDQIRTGDPRVDAVIDDVARIGERPLSDQPAEFENAQERLRRVLDTPTGDAQPGSD